MRSALRWLARLARGAALLVAVVVLLLVLTTHTEWGRDQLRTRVEAALRQAFPGGARVGRIEVSLFGTLRVRDVELRDREHRPLVTIGALRGQIAWWPLVVDTVRADAVVAEDVHVFARRGSAEPPPGARGAPSPWRFELPHVAIRGAVVTIEAGSATQTLAGLEVIGGLVASATGVSISVWGHGQWQDRAAELTATGAVVIDGTVRVPGALVTLGGASIVATGLAIDPGHPSGALQLRVPAAALRQVFPELAGAAAGDWWHDVTASIDVAATSRTTSRVVLDAAAGATRVWASLYGEPAQRTARGVISASAIDLAAVTAGRFEGRGDVLAALDGGARGVRGTLLAHCAHAEAQTAGLGANHAGRPSLACGSPEVPFHDAVVAIDGAFDRAVDTLRVLAFGRGTGGLDAFVNATAHRDDRSIALDDVRGFATATGGTVAGRAVTGALAANARARGSLRPLDVAITGEATGNAAAVDGISVAGARASFALRIAHELSFDRAHVAATGVRSGATRLGAATVDLESRGDGTFTLDVTSRPASGIAVAAAGVVTPSASGTHATLGRAQVALPDGTVWAGDGGSISVTSRSVALAGATLHNGDATVVLGGELDRRTGGLVAHADAHGFAASRIDAGYRGRARGALDVAHRGGRWQIDGTLDVAGFAARAGAAPVDATAHVALAGPRATLDAAVTGPQLGAVELAFEATAPRDPLDLLAWRDLDRDAIHNATITARGVQLAGVTGIAGAWDASSDAALTGTIDGAVNLAPAALRGSIAVRATDPLFGAIDGDLAFAPRDGDLGVRSSARWSGVAAAELTARFAVPTRPFDPATWRRGGRDLLQEATLDLEDVAFDPALLARLGIAARLARHGIAAPYRGRATVALALGAAATEAALTVDLEDVTGGVVVEPVSQHVALRASPAGTHVQAAWFGPTPVPGASRLALGVLDADLAVPTDRWVIDPIAALRAPLTARWSLPVTQLAPILDLVGRRELAAGTLEGSATITGTLGAPIVEAARLVARDVAVIPRLGGRPTPALASLEAVAQWDGARGSAEVTGRGATGGTLHAVAFGRPDQPEAATGALTATRLDISWGALMLLRTRVPTAGVVDAELALRAGEITGALHLTGGELPIAASIGTLRDVSADLAIGRTITGTFDGALGGGTVHGEAHLRHGTTATAVLKLRNVPALGAARPIITADLEAPCLDVTTAAARLCGDVTVKNARITLPEHPGTPLLDPSVPGDLVFVGADTVGTVAPSQPSHPWLVASVILQSTRISAGAVVEGIGFQATLHGRDKLAVSIGDTIGVVGDVVLDSADVDLLGRRYDLERSELQFDGTVDPVLAIHLRHQFPELALNVAITERASRWKLHLSSDPGGYSDDQLFGFLLGGEPGGDPVYQTREAVAGASSRLVSGALGRRLSKVLPIKLDAISCEPATTVTSASCSAGKWFSERLFLSYRRTSEPLPDENANGLDLQYRLGRKSFELTGGDRAHYGADLLWRHRW